MSESNERLLSGDPELPLSEMPQMTSNEDQYVDFDESAVDDHAAQEPKNGLLATASTIVSNMIGVGVLGLPAAVKGLGWGLFIFFLFLFTALSIYSSLIIAWLKGSMLSILGYPELAADAAKGKGPKTSKRYRKFVQVMLFSYLQGVCTLYLITMKLSLEAVFESCSDEASRYKSTPRGATCERPACSDHGIVDLPDSVWLFFCVIILFPFVHYRSLAKNSWLSFVGVVTILVVDFVILVRCLEEIGKKSHHADTKHHWEFRDVVNSITIVVFAYGGHALMPDIINEMKEPKQFNKAVYWSQGFMALNYIIIGLVGYAAYGNTVQSPITLSLPKDGVSIFTNVLLLLHVGVAYCINSTVFVRNILDAIWPGFVHSSTNKVLLRKRWGGVSLAVLLASFIVAAIIPYFSDLMDIYSAVCIFALSIWIPALLIIVSQQGQLSIPLLIGNALLIFCGIALSILGIYAAFDDLIDKLSHCKVHFGY